ncbi:DUF91 domain-containing protein [Nocardioides sp. Y6]|uniref:DUF91 domain-containing protein n=1 Tax=Nocardioides malaquae TaxID=2773426 RepID=A0ABR9RQP1_9ACTN|nr:endonuclease NucS domain-containing protein [Nocardioides malaquae]MBE7323892.1 DUF91 domain-containing protein [Nocardioides malaquae]
MIEALRDAIDGLFLDGYSILAPPFSLTYRTDPVAPVFMDRLESASDEQLQSWWVGDFEAVAAWLAIPVDDYLRHPVASEMLVFLELLNNLGIQDADGRDGQQAVAIARAWLDTFDVERPYRLGHVGLERDLEVWLVHNIEALEQVGYHVYLRHQQYVLPDRRRPDLVLDRVEADGSTSTLVVELKATQGYIGAVDQLTGYVEAFRAGGFAPGPVHGLLIADGFSPEVLAYARAQGIDTLTLQALGYRRALAYAPTTAKPNRSAREGSEGNMKRYVLYSQPLQVDEATPMLWVVAEDLHSLPVDIRPFDPSDEKQAWLAQDLSARLDASDALLHMTVAKLAVSFGGITHADGSPVEQLDSTPGVVISSGREGYLGVRAMQAGTDFVQAIWRLRKDITAAPPRMVADWLRRAPEVLQGDDGLPEHIEVAADALEGLPVAILELRAPGHYDGTYDAFLTDAVRVFESVARRLEQLTIPMET